MRSGARSRHRATPGGARPLPARSGRYRGRVIERSEQGADPAAAAGAGPPGPFARPGPRDPLAPSAWAPPPPGSRPGSGPPPAWAPPPPRGDAPVAAGPPDADASLGRQLAAGGAPSSRSSAWMWMLFAGLGFLGGQVLAALLGGGDGRLHRQPARPDGHHQAGRAAHLVHRVDPHRVVGRVLRRRLDVVVRPRHPQPGQATSGCGSGGSTSSASPSGWAASSWWR